MATWRFTKSYRSRLSEKLMDLGNLVAIALVFRQFLTKEREFSPQIFTSGIIVAVICYTVSYLIDN